MSNAQDDKSQYCIPFILERLEIHRQKYEDIENAPPFFLGLNGVQGAGKTLLVSIIQSVLQNPPHSLPTVAFSFDDLYLTHADQESLAQSHPQNPLLQHRGQPSTHDIPLALSTFSSLSHNKTTAIPRYDKSAFCGQGERVSSTEWETVNAPDTLPIKVVLFEGWCVGFRPISSSDLQQKWSAAVHAIGHDPAYGGQLGHNAFHSIADINTALHHYNQVTNQLDAFIHIDARDPQYVYKWRQQQEAGLRAKSGTGMTDAQVKQFVDGYYPAYELFSDALRHGVFGTGDHDKGRQLRLAVGEDRKVIHVERT